ncbi:MULTISPECIES: sigma-70 family RNA polymerase sigma factor [Mycolicibacterium]|uniref:RNA polymerase, sigma-24 subunit, ECF subfamily n=1 Tax=Mycolicibacterium vanbaalenii (strain DSM 7251 / JCM 13017 / BCRC 16820 / KCTC 9966 / NRRL B-24157 / PYR-1) TaxID=350058 RepID=A1T5F5_MYCVP|nr:MULTISPECIES: sigma-70 family RNA polymerase sigma factor [Mycolicibacterium]ABM12405.1 RNA polymerase, sigma-24 subunit, ECF subfamily [Mycolicibacterium vanbaalenii PYR-1]MCV7129562.1 sigma-70 family RNA polymerase sigma factor [Mycolicibacterium vanbaalenii PYR-1]QRZ08235.1 sigma-70 family RNA polymerase sigma factor [Mycolicibacterium austroafricanum]QZT69887.1 sigma-70 family RNA polymerase sigma factor [Mycolicibacterium austroafricanum]
MTTSARVGEFEQLRPHLLSVAYRLTGTLADAEDIVQDAWLRWEANSATVIEDLKAWLTTVVSRLALDRLRSAAHRRETYVGEWLPEPVVTGFDGVDPLASVVAGEDARFAAMVVLENLTPDQRVAFVLHDGFAVPFAEIAEVLGSSPESARQLASRARRAASAAPPPADEHAEVVGKLLAAMASGDLTEVVAVLHPDVTFTGDSNRRAPTAARVIHGSDKVARFLLGLARRYGEQRFFGSGVLGMVNGELGVYTMGAPATEDAPAIAPRIQALTVHRGQVVAIYDIANPDKFTASPLR